MKLRRRRGGRSKGPASDEQAIVEGDGWEERRRGGRGTVLFLYDSDDT
jgi:hypothetical protein